MSVKKISDLTPANQLSDNDSFVFNDVVAGNDKRVTAGNLLDAIDGASITYVDDKASLSPTITGNVKAFGAKGDGSADDTDAFRAAFLNYDTVFIPNGYYLLRSGMAFYDRERISLIGESQEGVVLDFSQLDPLIDYEHNFADIAFAGSIEMMSDLDSSVSRLDTEITFESAHNLSVGDVFYICNQDDFSFSSSRSYYRQGDMCQIKSVIDSTTVELVKPLYASYDILGSTIATAKPSLCQLSIERISIIPNPTKYGLAGNYLIDCNIKNVKIPGSSNTKIYLSHVYNGTLSKISLVDGKGATNTNYGIVLASCQSVKINNSSLEGGSPIDWGATPLGYGMNDEINNRDLSIPCRDCSANQITSIGRLTSHGLCEFIELSNSFITGNVLFRGGSFRIVNNNFYDITRLQFGESVDINHDITNNRFMVSGPSGATYAVYDSLIRVADINADDFNKNSFLNIHNNVISDPNNFIGRSIAIRTYGSTQKRVSISITNNDCDQLIDIRDDINNETLFSELTIENNIAKALSIREVEYDLFNIGGNKFSERCRFDTGSRVAVNNEISFLNLRDNDFFINEENSSGSWIRPGNHQREHIITIQDNRFLSRSNITGSTGRMLTPIWVYGFKEVIFNENIIGAVNDPDHINHPCSFEDVESVYIHNNKTLGDKEPRFTNVNNVLTCSDYKFYTGDPNGAINPTAIGSEVYDIVNKNWYKAVGLGNEDWSLSGSRFGVEKQFIKNSLIERGIYNSDTWGNFNNTKLVIKIRGLSPDLTMKMVKVKYNMGDTSSGAIENNNVGEVIYSERGTGSTASEDVLHEKGGNINRTYIPIPNGLDIEFTLIDGYRNRSVVVVEVLDESPLDITVESIIESI